MDGLIEQFLGMSDRDLAIAFVMLIVPAVTAVLANMAWSPAIKLGLFLAVCAGASLALLWGYGSLERESLPRLFLMIVLISGVVYRLFKSGLDHVGVLTDRAIGRQPASSVSPPAVDIQSGTVATVTDSVVTQNARND